jgi:hypothetical protein
MLKIAVKNTTTLFDDVDSGRRKLEWWLLLKLKGWMDSRTLRKSKIKSSTKQENIIKYYVISNQQITRSRNSKKLFIFYVKSYKMTFY